MGLELCAYYRMRSRFLVLLAALAPCDASGEQGEIAINRFVNLVHASHATQTGFVVDVGANNGQWARHILERVRNYGTRVRVEPVLFEPQREYASSLQHLADDWGGTFYPAVAWTRATNLSFYISNFKEASSLSEQLALTFSKPEVNEHVRRVTVPAVDLARVLRNCVWRAKGGPIILKLDVEAAEYDVLPRLLITGALCRCTFLVVEWHLNALPPGRRLEGMLLRNAFDKLLARGCFRPPRLIIHDEDFLNNFGEAIPGLNELVMHYQVKRHLPNKRPFAVAASVIAGRSRRQREDGGS